MFFWPIAYSWITRELWLDASSGFLYRIFDATFLTRILFFTFFLLLKIDGVFFLFVSALKRVLLTFDFWRIGDGEAACE